MAQSKLEHGGSMQLEFPTSRAPSEESRLLRFLFQSKLPIPPVAPGLELPALGHPPSKWQIEAAMLLRNIGNKKLDAEYLSGAMRALIGLHPLTGSKP